VVTNTKAPLTLPTEDARGAIVVTQPTILESGDIRRSRNPYSLGVREVMLAAGVELQQGRLRVLRMLGEGGVGTVFEAFDNRRRETVALKLLSRLNASGIYGLKNEFRVLSDVRHPNLVRLHELFSEDGLWFFTMDRVAGERFDRWVRPDGQLHPTRLRPALAQLLSGVEAIHAAGKVHRDLKPSNVLVTAEGRVVVLDFGLVADSAAGGIGLTLDGDNLSGTPAYMAPEQAAGHTATTASDLYALGVMLFESLTGRLPISGSVGEVLAAKQRDAVPAPSSIAEAVPADLDALCQSLLRADPEARAKAAEVRILIGQVAQAAAGEHVPAAPAEPVQPLLGREPELQRMREAYRATLSGTSVVLIVSGESGIGKTALCDAFLHELRAAGEAVVLAGRCYERENVPFKAFDALIDELSRYLRRLPPIQAAALLPRDIFALAKLFPVLNRVDVVAQAPARDVPDPRALRRLGFAAYRELLARIGDRQPLVAHTDDLQWIDSDSVAFMRQLLFNRAVRTARGLFIASHRSEQLGQGSLLGQTLEAIRKNPRLDVRVIELSPLAMPAALELTRRVLLPEADVHSAEIETIAREAAGNPYFLGELARSPRAADGALGSVSVSAMLEQRVAALSPPAQRLLHVLALAGQPLDVEVALQAAEATHAELDGLRAAHLVRGLTREAKRTLECYHDRIRLNVCTSLAEPQRRARFTDLMRALLASGEGDFELLSYCSEGAGDAQTAARHARSAAEQAAAALAFEHAAALYRRALALGGFSEAERFELTVECARALDNAGRSSDAATKYLEAALLTRDLERIELRRCAAEQLLGTGHLERGTAILQTVGADLGMSLSRNSAVSAVSFAWSCVRTPAARVGTPRMTHRPISARDALRLRVARTAVTGLISYQPIQAASAAGRYLEMAAEYGQRDDRIEALGMNAHIHSLLDPKSRRAARLSVAMQELAAESGTPRMLGFASMIQGALAYHADDFPAARVHLDRALRRFRDCTRGSWESDQAHLYDQMAAAQCGDHADIARTTPALIDEAFRRERVWAGAMLSGWSGLPAFLVGNDMDGYRHQLDEARRHWRSGDEAKWPDYLLGVGEAYLEVYAGNPARAFDLLDSARIRYARSGLSRGVNRSAMYGVHRGRCAASALRMKTAAHDGAGHQRWVAALHESCAALQRHGGDKSLGNAALFLAALALHRAEPERAAEHLERALGWLDRANLAMTAAATRRRLGQLVQGERGRALIAEGDRFMHSQNIADLEATSELWCPGCASRAV
jgi:eukaryotic-like serine/threonine-protein kinase